MSYTSPLCLPLPSGWESPCSFITRVAASQGASPEEICNYLGVQHRCDLDLVISNRPAAPRDVTIGTDRLIVARRIFTGLVASGLPPKVFLLYSKTGMTRYRYCALCLRDMRPAVLPVHWRFAAWRVCPLHSTLMEDACPHCNATLELPADLSQAGPKRIGVASLKLCLTCGGSLTDAMAIEADDWFYERLGDGFQMLAENGRALLAALWAGSFYTNRGAGPCSLTRLAEVDAMRALPNDPDWTRPYSPVRRGQVEGRIQFIKMLAAKEREEAFERATASVGSWSGARMRRGA